jgi:histidine triad (HIT) family protein
MDNCVFCKIASGKTDTKLIKETKNLIIIKDINPQASVHLLILPKKHIRDISEVDDKLWNDIREVAVYFARERSLSGFRLIHNAGDLAKIPHMQVHLLADTDSIRSI